MTIGVDGGALSITDNRLKLGVYWVNVNLLRELAKIDKKNTYILYGFAPIEEDFGPRIKGKILRPRRGWFSLRLPLELTLHPVDVFLGISQAIPPSTARNIGFVYDLGFLHHPEAYPWSARKLKKQTEELIKRSDHIVCISHAVRKDIEATYGKKNITVAYPGVDETFVPKGKIFKNKYPYFLFVGALKRGKNIPFLIRAFHEFLKEVKKPFDLLLVGSDFWLDPAITFGPRVRFLGYVPDTKLASLYRGANAFVSPSLWEGFCLPAAEALACGTPVIASTTGAFPEIVGKSGTLVDPTNEEELVRALVKHAKKISTAPKKFSWHSFARAVYNLL